ncbi:MAG TPA: hypothetical protein VE955_10740, partial [Candidatus Dormibacteraeota bacterium]|nr:hypothetical protein [Candidatus Dormibacteraeota bacterium]
ANSIAQTPSGGYVVGGSCTGGVTTSACADVSEPAAIVMMLDPSGNIQSQTQYLYKSYPYSTPSGLIRPTSDGGAIFAGNAQFGCPATGQTSCATIVKVDSTGHVQWTNDLQFSTSSTYSPFTWPLDLQTTSDGGTVVTGYAFAPADSYNPFVAKLSSTGQVQWQHVYADPNSGYSYAVGVRQTPDGGYAVAGEVSYTITSSYTESDLAVFKLDSTGNLTWQHSYLVGTDSYAESLALTSDGGFIVGGLVSINTSTSYSSAVLLLKLDSTGNPQFAKTYVPTGSISDLTIAEVRQTTDGGYAFAGHYFENTIYDQRAWLVKTDSGGNVQWDKIYGADVEYSTRTFNSFQQTSDGGFIAAGSTNQYNNGYNSLWIVRTDSNGNISGCRDVKNGSDTSGSVAVKVSNSDLTVVKDSFSYLADILTVSPAPFTATKEC